MQQIMTHKQNYSNMRYRTTTANEAREIVQKNEISEDDTIFLQKNRNVYCLQIQDNDETFYVNVLKANKHLIQFEDINLQSALYLAIDFVYV